MDYREKMDRAKAEPNKRSELLKKASLDQLSELAADIQAEIESRAEGGDRSAGLMSNAQFEKWAAKEIAKHQSKGANNV